MIRRIKKVLRRYLGPMEGFETEADFDKLATDLHRIVDDEAELLALYKKRAELQEIVDAFITWANMTFKKATPESCIAHLKSEIEELEEAPYDPEELADAAMLIIHAAHLAGVDLKEAIWEKYRKNRDREWGEPNEEGYVEHVRDEEP